MSVLQICEVIYLYHLFMCIHYYFNYYLCMLILLSFIQAETAAKIDDLLRVGDEEAAIKLVMSDASALKWKDPDVFNFSLMHICADYNRKAFLKFILREEVGFLC